MKTDQNEGPSFFYEQLIVGLVEENDLTCSRDVRVTSVAAVVTQNCTTGGLSAANGTAFVTHCPPLVHPIPLPHHGFSTQYLS